MLKIQGLQQFFQAFYMTAGSSVNIFMKKILIACV